MPGVDFDAVRLAGERPGTVGGGSSDRRVRGSRRTVRSPEDRNPLDHSLVR